MSETVVCGHCGQRVEKNRACGVKMGGSPTTWTCTTCIKQGAMDRVFAPIGKTIKNIARAATKDEA